MRFGDLTLRSGTAVTIVAGLLITIVATFFTRGFDETQRLFMLLQGILLGAFGWLYGSHGTDRAENIAASAEAGRRLAADQIESTEQRLERLLRDFALSRALLAEAMSIPGVRERVMASLGTLEVDADDA